MIEVSRFVGELEKGGVGFFTGVPDSLLKSFCAWIADNRAGRHVIAANEGAAVALAAGRHLATGEAALVYMQNSGEGNAVNPLASLADPDVYSIPMVLLVGWRGEPGVHDEPQHVKQGKITLSLLETMGIPAEVLSENEDEALLQVRRMVKLAREESRPVALVARKGAFAGYVLQSRVPDVAPLVREKAIEEVLSTLPEDAAVVSTTGMISREVYETRERRGEGHGRDFLTVGSMGHAVMIALGIAKARPERPVFCLDGDGAVLMHMGSLAIAGQSGAANLTHIVFNNAAHDSVGGQPTVAGAIDLAAVAAACGYNRPGAPVFKEIKVAKGARKDLGRPKEPPQVNKRLFMESF